MYGIIMKRVFAILTLFLISLNSPVFANGGDDPPTPSKQSGGPVPPGFSVPIDQEIPFAVLAGFVIGGAYIYKQRERI
ncbi:hypothetical protein [Zunongwangia endophytica]|uniref:PEP-CTERM protein-sorting domain-containing protein n=1 Tax=Zunongwangia endophytica TaxID=1808945 RepID=A0ABV8H658_9FLAO|nr:hypothetical protein [Zunongwangia endophytica]MDN3596011.1 hypothetical protein [Zunongwangia endophytica]